MHGIILEGVSCIGKSVIFRGLQQRMAKVFSGQTTIAFDERYTFRMLEHLAEKGQLHRGHISEHLDGLITLLERLEGMRRSSKFSHHVKTQVPVLIERGPLSHYVRSIRLEAPYLFEQTEVHLLRLNRLGIHQILLVASCEMLEARIRSAYVARNDAWRQYVETFGSVGAFLESCLENQATLIRAAGRLREIETTTLIIDHEEWSYWVDEIFRRAFVVDCGCTNGQRMRQYESVG